MKNAKESSTKSIEGLRDFLQNSPTPFHAVASLKTLLTEKDFEEVFETDAWKVKPGGKYFVSRNGSSLVAFQMGDGNPEEQGFRISGAHTDSPCLRVKPVPEIVDRHYTRLGVEVYGGVLLSTWFDRDLSLAGRVFYSRKGAKAPEQALIDFERPIAIVPNLAIHLNRSVNEKRSINPQTEMPPLLGQLAQGDFQAALLEELENAGAKGAEEVLSHELYFYDTQAPALVGLKSEFLASSRLDNLASCYVGATALAQGGGRATSVLVCNDHEEVGSASAPGAQGTFLKSVLERLAGGGEAMTRAIARSVLVSTDNSHGVHPSYPEKTRWEPSTHFE